MSKSNITELYDSHFKDLFRYSLSIVKSIPVAEDITQNAFVKLLNRQDSVENPVHFLKRTVRNFSINHIRDEKRNKEKEAIFTEEEIVSNICKEDLSDKIDNLYTLLDTLSPETRKAIIFRCVEGMKFIELSEELDTPIPTLKSRIQVGLKKIRKGIVLFIMILINLL